MPLQADLTQGKQIHININFKGKDVGKQLCLFSQLLNIRAIWCEPFPVLYKKYTKLLTSGIVWKCFKHETCLFFCIRCIWKIQTINVPGSNTPEIKHFSHFILQTQAYGVIKADLVHLLCGFVLQQTYKNEIAWEHQSFGYDKHSFCVVSS